MIRECLRTLTSVVSGRCGRITCIPLTDWRSDGRQMKWVSVKNKRKHQEVQPQPSDTYLICVAECFSESFMVDTMIWYNTTSPFAVFVWPSPMLVCVTYTGYDWLYAWFHGGACPLQVTFTLPGHLFIHLGFPERPCCLESLFPALLCLWNNDIWLTDDGRLFPSFIFTNRWIRLSNVYGIYILSIDG